MASLLVRSIELLLHVESQEVKTGRVLFPDAKEHADQRLKNTLLLFIEVVDVQKEGK